MSSLKKTRPEIQIHFSSPKEEEEREYKDTFPEDMPTMEDVKKKYGKIVWCKYLKCKHNVVVKGLQRTTGTILKNRTYKPIGEQENIWEGICSRDEIAIRFDEVQSGSVKAKVPSCFSAVSGVSGHVDFTRFLNSDGSPLGGNIDSQHVSDAGYGAMDSGNIYEG